MKKRKNWLFFGGREGATRRSGFGKEPERRESSAEKRQVDFPLTYRADVETLLTWNFQTLAKPEKSVA